MLGHTLWGECEKRFEASTTIRADQPDAVALRALDPDCIVAGVRAEDLSSVERALDRSGAEVAVNCIGLVKQLASGADPAAMVAANALFPQQLAAACRERAVRLVHVSTDCVFSGRRGGYTESDLPDPEDLYGRSKLAGEPEGSGVLTLRTSMIGRELAGSHGLLEWFLAQKGEVRGFTRAVFTGPTAPVLSRAICDLIEDHPRLEGTWHLGAEPITKHELMLLLRDTFQHDVEIVPDGKLKIDRSLNSSRLRSTTGWEAPSWPEMVAELSSRTSEPPEARPRVAGR